MSSSTDTTIGVLTWDYSQPKGGMGRSMQRMVNMLRTSGYTLCVGAPGGDVNMLPVTRRFGGHLLFSVLVPFFVERFIHTKRIDVLMVPSGPGGVFLFRKPSVPVLAIVYHTYAQQAACVPGQGWKKIFVPFERRTLRGAKRIICYCEDTRRTLIETYGIDVNRIDLCAHRIDVPVKQGSEKREKGLCVCVARLEARKGVDVLLRAWPLVIQKLPDARLVIVGKGVGAKRIDTMIEQMDGTVRRMSDISHTDMYALLARAEVAVCPSYLEGFGLAAAEAMAAGSAVVATDCDGLRSLITHEQTGLLVAPGDVHALAAAIVRMLSDDIFRANVSDAARVNIGAMCDSVRATQDLSAALHRVLHEHASLT